MFSFFFNQCAQSRFYVLDVYFLYFGSKYTPTMSIFCWRFLVFSMVNYSIWERFEKKPRYRTTGKIRNSYRVKRVRNISLSSVRQRRDNVAERSNRNRRRRDGKCAHAIVFDARTIGMSSRFPVPPARYHVGVVDRKTVRTDDRAVLLEAPEHLLVGHGVRHAGQRQDHSARARVHQQHRHVTHPERSLRVQRPFQALGVRERHVTSVVRQAHRAQFVPELHVQHGVDHFVHLTRKKKKKNCTLSTYDPSWPSHPPPFLEIFFCSASYDSRGSLRHPSVATVDFLHAENLKNTTHSDIFTFSKR